MSNVRDVLLEAANQLDAADRLLEHARRATYQAGCRCLPCCAANARYQSEYRRRLRSGTPLLGASVSGDGTAKRLRALFGEGYTQRQLAQLLGLSRMTLIRHTVSTGAERRTVAKVARFWRTQQE